MQKSAYEMLISDWSSDVCSSDLSLDQAQRLLGVEPVHAHHARARQQGEAREKERPVMIERTGIERSEEHTSELQSLMRISYAVFCLKKKTTQQTSIVDTKIKH